jgi:hypothetical protein
MLTKRSRYYKLDDTVHPDRFGIPRKTKALRQPPVVFGQFLHTIEASDRLDHLAYKYYRQSLHWWRICDANPEFLSPRALLGKAPQETLAMQVQWNAPNPPWHELFDALKSLTGVEHIVKGGRDGAEPSFLVDEGTALFTLVPALLPTLDEAATTQQLPALLATALQAEGLVLNGSLRISKPGETRWQIEAMASGEYYLLSYSASAAATTVYATVLTHTWALVAVYNTKTLTQTQLTAAITALGFEVVTPEVLTRIGQRIVVPPRYTGV